MHGSPGHHIGFGAAMLQRLDRSIPIHQSSDPAALSQLAKESNAFQSFHSTFDHCTLNRGLTGGLVYWRLLHTSSRKPLNEECRSLSEVVRPRYSISAFNKGLAQTAFGFFGLTT